MFIKYRRSLIVILEFLVNFLCKNHNNYKKKIMFIKYRRSLIVILEFLVNFLCKNHNIIYYLSFTFVFTSDPSNLLIDYINIWVQNANTRLVDPNIILEFDILSSFRDNIISFNHLNDDSLKAELVRNAVKSLCDQSISNYRYNFHCFTNKFFNELCNTILEQKCIKVNNQKFIMSFPKRLDFFNIVFGINISEYITSLLNVEEHLDNFQNDIPKATNINSVFINIVKNFINTYNTYQFYLFDNFYKQHFNAESGNSHIKLYLQDRQSVYTDGPSFFRNYLKIKEETYSEYTYYSPFLVNTILMVNEFYSYFVQLLEQMSVHSCVRESNYFLCTYEFIDKNVNYEKILNNILNKKMNYMHFLAHELFHENIPEYSQDEYHAYKKSYMNRKLLKEKLYIAKLDAINNNNNNVNNDITDNIFYKYYKAQMKYRCKITNYEFLAHNLFHEDIPGYPHELNDEYKNSFVNNKRLFYYYD